jgi:DNA topoisomerase-3
VELIGLIHEELLKSAELTGIWEKKLREIERRSYDAATFLGELKQMVAEIVHSVIADPTNRRVTTVNLEAEAPVKKASGEKVAGEKTAGEKKPRKTAAPRKPKAAAPKAEAPAAKAEAPATDALIGTPCPLCGKGTLIKGKTAYGCSEWRNGCTYRKQF